MSSAARAMRRRNEASSGWQRDHEWQRSLEGALTDWPDGAEPPTCWRRGPLAALVGREPVGKDDPRWHISVQHQDRVPSWEEMVQAAHALRPGIVFVIGVPPRSWWMNIHPHVLHLWELRDEALIGQWRFEGQGHEPS